MFSSDSVKKFNNLPTPFYYYDIDIIKNNLKSLKYSLRSNNKVHFSVKSNTNKRILEIVKSYNLGIDAVSYNEIKHCLDQGFDSKDIVFAGVGKTDEEIKKAIEKDIAYFNVESFQELDVINQLSKKQSKQTEVSIRINPNIFSETNKKIQTGSKDDKFGVQLEDISKFSDYDKLSNINITGIHFHIGSQILNLSPFEKLCKITNETISYLEGNGVTIKNINVGG